MIIVLTSKIEIKCVKVTIIYQTFPAPVGSKFLDSVVFSTTFIDGVFRVGRFENVGTRGKQDIYLPRVQFIGVSAFDLLYFFVVGSCY